MGLEDLRTQLDELDQQILELLNQRHAACVEVGALKRASGLAVYDPSREAEILARLERLNTGPLPNETLLAIYAEILRASQEEQRRIVDGGK